MREYVFEEPDKRAPVCPLFGKCGGCSLLNVQYSAQVREKQASLVEAFGSLCPEATVLDPVTGPELGYRSRARFTYSKQGLSFSEEKSNDQVLIDHCPILDDKLNDLLANPPVMNVWELPDRQLSCFSADKKVLWGNDMGWVTVGNRKLPVTGDVFFQSNLVLLPQLIDYVVSLVEGRKVMDLYAGVGTFSAFLEDKFDVTAVEINKKCLSLAKQHLKNTRFFTFPVERWNPKVRSVDTVIVDPPRVGLDRNVPSMVSSWNPDRVIYVSCYLPTMLRDIERFMGLGWTVKQVRMFDFYPNTPHTETVATLFRS